MEDKKGFTLIELLVVIAIIGLLSTLAVVALNQARAKSRDAKRLADGQAIAKAIELYYDENGTYPLPNQNHPNGFLHGLADSAQSNTWDADCAIEPTPGFPGETLGCLLKDYVQVPLDPTNNGIYSFRYDGENTGEAYELFVTLESDDASNCSAQGPWYFGLWGICNAGGFGFPNLNMPNAIRFYNSE